MTLLGAIYRCKTLNNKFSANFVSGIITSVSCACILAILGGLCGVAVDAGYFTEGAFNHLSVIVALLIVALQERDYTFVRPLCPLVSHRTMALFKMSQTIISVNNGIIVCIIAPFYFFSTGGIIPLSIIVFSILLNTIISLVVLNLETVFFKFKFSKTIFVILILLYFSFIVIFRTRDFHTFFGVSSCSFATIASLLLLTIILIATSYHFLKVYSSELYENRAATIKVAINYKAYDVIWNTVLAIVKQYFRCPAYKKILTSALGLIISGIFFLKFDGTEYIGAALIIGSYSMSMLQYSSSFLSKSPDLFFTAPISISDFVLAFSLINTITSFSLCLALSLYIKFVAGNAIFPILSLWALICGPLSKIIMTDAIFPIKIDIWSKNPELSRTPVQIFLSILAAFILFLAALLIQFKTIESSAIIGVFSLVSIFMYYKYIFFLETKINQRKYIILNSLR